MPKGNLGGQRPLPAVCYDGKREENDARVFGITGHGQTVAWRSMADATQCASA